jgi:hypothetical protein
MNPLVHTPQFYRLLGAMDEEELQASLKMPLSSTSAASSRFQFGTPEITVNCDPGQWWIQGSNLESWDRMLKITALVFGKLGGTPMISFAIVAQRHVDTSVSSVKAALVAKITATGLGFPKGESITSNIELVLREEDYFVTTAVQPSILGEQTVYAFYQRQYPVSATEAGAIILEPVVRGRLTAFSEGSQRFFDAAVAGISSTDVNV